MATWRRRLHKLGWVTYSLFFATLSAERFPHGDSARPVFVAPLSLTFFAVPLLDTQFRSSVFSVRIFELPFLLQFRRNFLLFFVFFVPCLCGNGGLRNYSHPHPVSTRYLSKTDPNPDLNAFRPKRLPCIPADADIPCPAVFHE